MQGICIFLVRQLNSTSLSRQNLEKTVLLKSLKILLHFEVGDTEFVVLHNSFPFNTCYTVYTLVIQYSWISNARWHTESKINICIIMFVGKMADSVCPHLDTVCKPAEKSNTL